MITVDEKEILWRAIDEYRRVCGTPDLPSDLILMARRAVERAVEDICMRAVDNIYNYIGAVTAEESSGESMRR